MLPGKQLIFPSSRTKRTPSASGGQTPTLALVVGSMATILVLLLGALVAVVQPRQSIPASVPYSNSNRVPALEQEGGGSAMFKRVAPSVVLIEVYDRRGVKLGQGSGFFVDGRGTVVTNAHVALSVNAASLKVSIFDDQLQATGVRNVDSVVSTDVENDIAVLRLNWRPVRFVRVRTAPAEIGERVFAIGNPIGLLHTMSDGLISGRREANGIEVLQISAPISPGSSGGPLVDADGNLVGVTTAGIPGETLNFAIPSSTVTEVLRSSGEPQKISSLTTSK